MTHVPYPVGIIRDLPFSERPGFRPVTLDLHRPTSSTPVPVVLELHGGGWRVGRRGVFTPLVTEERSFGRIAAAGFAVVAADYRLSGEAQFPAQVDDVLAAIDWIGIHADEFGLDASRIVLWGGSAGATLAALATIRRPQSVRGVVDWYGPSDLLEMAAFTAEKGADAAGQSREDLWLGAPVASIPETAIAASPARQVTADLPPFHIAHGMADTEVPPGQSELLAAALRAVGVEVELHREPGAGHFWKGADEAATDALFDRAIAFARRVIA